MGSFRLRRSVVIAVLLLLAAIPMSRSTWPFPTLDDVISVDTRATAEIPAELKELSVKGRAPKTGYERSQFGDGWDTLAGCSTRNRILARDLTSVVINDECKVDTGKLNDPYTGQVIQFQRGESTSDDVQIDHIVALSNAWQTGAQQLAYERRVLFANDPLNLLAVSGPANEEKSDGDAATWLPANKAFRCTYVKRQIAVKLKYQLWVTIAERDAMARVLATC